MARRFNHIPVGTVGIYKISSPSGKFYIGSSVDVRKRWSEHYTLLEGKAGGHYNRYLVNAAKKYGLDNLTFDILETCERTAVREREQHYIDTLKPAYNLSTKVEALMEELWQRPGWREANAKRLAEQNKKRWAEPGALDLAREQAKVMHTPQAKAKSVASRIKRLAEDPEHREKSAANARAMAAMCNARPEFRAARSERQRKSMIELHKRPGYKEHMIERIRATKCKKVVCVETGEVFQSLGAVDERYGGKNRSNISAICNGTGHQRTSYGFKWSWAKDGD